MVTAIPISIPVISYFKPDVHMFRIATLFTAGSLRLYGMAILLCLVQSSFATVKTWVGGSSGSWSVAGNWSPAGVPVTATSPAVGDDIIFDGSLSSSVTITDYPAKTTTDLFGQLSVINGVTVNISSASNTYFYFGNGLTVDVTSRINIGAATTTIFEFGSMSTVASTGLIYGIVDMQGTGTNASTNRKFYVSSAFGGSTRVYGKIILSGPSAQLSNFATSWTRFYIESGGELQWARDGAALPGLTCQDGGIINITGVVTTTVTLDNIGNYYGLIIWNCPSQTGNALGVVPSVGLLFHVDSVRIINTGSGTASLGVTPCYSVGHLEVQGGTLYLGVPTATTCASKVITSDFKITGGTVIGNATFPGDAGSAYPIVLPVNRDFIMTGGSFDLTNRPTGLSPGGYMQLNVGRNFIKTGGTLFATSAFGTQNSIALNSSSQAQDLQIDNLGSGTYSLNMNNGSTSFYVNLLTDFTMPPNVPFIFTRGTVRLNNNTLTIPYNNFSNAAGTPVPRFYTNGTGKIKFTGMPAASSLTVPLGALLSNSYEPLTIAPSGSAITNDYAIRVQYGNTPGGIYSPTRTIKRTWVLTTASSIVANSVALTFQYHDTTKGSSCTATAAMELGHFAGGSWHVDPAGVTNTPAGANPYTAGPFSPNSLDSAYVIGNMSSILDAPLPVVLKARPVQGNVVLSWLTGLSNNIQSIKTERSYNGQLFSVLAELPASQTMYEDRAPGSGLLYYRLQVTDNSGRKSYSNVAALQLNGKGWEMSNTGLNRTAGATLAVQVSASAAVGLQLQLADMQGRILLSVYRPFPAGRASFNVDISNLRPGVYALKGVATDGTLQVLRFVKQ